MTRSCHRCTLALLWAAVLPACGRGDAAPPASTGPRWVLNSQPSVVIGRGEGEDALFRVTAAARLPDGRIAVANAGTHQVKLFGADGKHLASIGGRGSGPGEFQVPTWVGAHADSILVWDAALERLTVLDAAGRAAPTAQFPSAGGAFPSVIGAFGDGSLLLASGTEPAAAARERGAWRGSTMLVRVSPGGAVLDTLATLPSDERYSYSSGGSATVEDLPFGRRTVMAVAGDRVVFGTGEEYRIRSVDTAATAQELFRAAWTPRRVSPADVEEYWSRMVTLGGGDDSADTEARRSRVPYPETLPPYEDLLLDSRGAIWIKDAQPPQSWDDPDVWRVYSSSGVLTATIELPARTRPQAIGDDWILALALDASHRELVQVYRYTRR